MPFDLSPINRAMSAIPSGELSRRSAQHLTVSQLRQPARQTLVESRRPASTRRSAATDVIAFGHGLDPHDHVLADRIPTDGGYARGDHLDVPSTDQRHPARNRAGVNMTKQQILQRCAHLGDRATLTTRIKPPPAPPQRRARAEELGLCRQARRRHRAHGPYPGADGRVVLTALLITPTRERVF